ncbi:MAG: polysaccharide export protein [Bacteroidetes bacterium]|nr:polysaccharide export protein [Bacteroidota bacterium]
MKRFIKEGGLLICIILELASCVPQRKFVYVQSKKSNTDHEYLVESKRNIKIESQDILYISIGSADQPTYNFFSQEKQNINTISEESLALLSYTVNDSGYVTLPIIGRIKLQGLTLDQASTAIRDFTKTVLTNPIVTVRFVNNTITILGEVARPGTVIYPKQQLNILSALGLVGDINEFGNRRKIVLIRETNKTTHKYYVDITKDDLFRSDYYYLRPNDILYVEPLRLRRIGFKEFPYSLILSSISSFFLIMFYINK